MPVFDAASSPSRISDGGTQEVLLRVKVNRPVYNEDQILDEFGIENQSRRKPNPFSYIFLSWLPSLRCSLRNFVDFIFSVIPVLTWLPRYKLKDDLLKDVAAGLTVGIMQIPQGMAYAMLTTLPAVTGLYVSFVPVLIYFFLGTSRHISLGTFAIVSLMVGVVIEGQAKSFIPVASIGNGTTSSKETQLEQYKMDVAITLSMLVGFMQIFMGIIRMGFVAVYLSDPLVSGFTTGAAFHILSSQVKHFFGLTIPTSVTSGFFSLFKLYYYIFQNIKLVNISALVIGLLCTISLFILKDINARYKNKLKFPLPAELFVVVLGTGISYGVGFNKKYETPILATVPKGIPSPTVPSFHLMTNLIAEAFTIAVVAFAINVSVVKAFAKKNKYKVDSNQELVAYGCANVVASFFSCFPSAVSLSRSLIQEELGSTQMAGVFSVVLVIVTLLALAPLFEPLPKAVLAAIVLVALKGLFKQFIVLKLLWKISKIDAFIWFTSFLAVICLGVDFGLGAGLIINLLTTVVRTSRPSFTLLGRVPGTEIYKSIDRYKVEESPGIKIFQYEASLYYANTEHFCDSVFMSTVDPGTCSMKKNSDVDLTEFNVATIDGDGEFSGTPTYKRRRSSSTRTSNRSDSVNKQEITISTPSVNGDISIKIEPGTDNSADIKTEKVMDLQEKIHSIILDFSQCAYIDSMGVTTLASMVDEYKKVGITVFISRCSRNVQEMLRAGGFSEVHGKGRIFLTVQDAVLHITKNRRYSKISPDLVSEESVSGTNDGDQNDLPSQPARDNPSFDLDE